MSRAEGRAEGEGITTELLLELLEHSPDLQCIAAADGGGSFSWVSKAWTRVLGWSFEELTTRPYAEFVHPEDVESTNTKSAAMFESGDNAASFENRYRTKQGEYRWLQWNAFVGPDNMVLASARDITESRRIGELLRRSERMVSIGTLAAGVAHELNNPLSYLIGNLELIQEELERLRPELDAEATRELDEMLDDALSGSHRVRRIVDGLRSFSRIGSAVTRDVDVHAAINSAVSIVEHEVRMRATLELRLLPCGAIHIDETQLVQVLVNLIVNAAQALPEGQAAEHEVSVEARQIGGQIELRVKDTGPGVPEPLRARIFDPFFTTKPVGTGTGLGLSICHSIITNHGGSIELEHTPVGACFCLRFPAATRQREISSTVRLPALELDAAEDEPSRPRLLLIDDERQVLTMLERALRHHYELVLSSSGQAALELLEHDREFDLLLCDLMMPEVSGPELLEALLERDPELAKRVMFATGGTIPEQVQALAESSGVEILHKPFDITGLRAQLRKRLATTS